MKVIQTYEEGSYTLREIAALFELSLSTVNAWMRLYRDGGVLALEERTKWTRYTKELKLQAVLDVLEGRGSLSGVTIKYGISSRSVLRKWIAKYNGHREHKAYPKERSSMAKGRTTTFEERIDAVLDCIAKEKDYRGTAETHRVSYHQIYSWVRKYEEGGADALMDRRGRKKPEEELTPEERFAIEQHLLERENERLRMELAFLKKLEEIERRRS